MFGRNRSISDTRKPNQRYFVIDARNKKAGLREIPAVTRWGNEELNGNGTMLRIRTEPRATRGFPTSQEKWLFDSPETLLAHELRHMANNVAGRNAGSPEDIKPEEVNVLLYEEILRDSLKLDPVHNSRWPTR